MDEDKGNLVNARTLAFGIGAANGAGSAMSLLKDNLPAALTDERRCHDGRVNFSGGPDGESFALPDRVGEGWVDPTAPNLPTAEGISDFLE